MGILIDQKHNQLHLKMATHCNFPNVGINFGSYCRSTIHILFCSCISPGKFLNLFLLFFLPCLIVFPVKKCISVKQKTICKTPIYSLYVNHILVYINFHKQQSYYSQIVSKKSQNSNINFYEKFQKKIQAFLNFRGF